MDEKRLSRMIHLAMFEQVDGKEDLAISRFFRGDYIGLGLLKNILLMTIAYVIVVGIYVLYNFETLAVEFSTLNLQPLFWGLLIIYLLVVGIFSVLVFVIRKLRYERAVRRILQYQKKLKELDEFYELEDLIEGKQRSN